MSSPQHVIWITADHLRWDDIAAHGFPFPHTPNIDRLVRGGVTFNNCFAQSPVCMPSRCSFMTGCYPHQSGVTSNGQDLRPDCPTTVARCFKAAGYQTAQIGKLHFESHEDNDLDQRDRHDYGFDIFWCDEEPGCYDGPYMRWLTSEQPSLVDRFRTARPVSPDRKAEAKTPKVVDATWHHSFSGWIAEQTTRYLSAWAGSRGRKERHFVHMGFYAPHPPLNPTADMMAPLAGKTPPPPLPAPADRAPALNEAEVIAYRTHFAAMVTGIDFAVGKLLGMLEDLGVLDDTLIVFGSDHGDFCGDHGLVAKGPAWYDSVARVPLVMHWPKGLQHRGEVDGLFELIDCMPTMLELCGQPVPTQIQGRSHAAALQAGELTAIDREDVFATIAPGHLMLRSKQYKYIRYNKPGSDPDEVLYDLRSDPDEMTDVAQALEQADALTRLRERALQRLLEASEPVTPRIYRF